MKRAILLGAMLALAGFVPSSARAFRTADTFDSPARDGGGGSRHFTGSINDGFTCAVCHRGGEVDPVEIEGLPLDGYVPGGTYEIEILLPPTSPTSSLGLELTDTAGYGVGSLALPATPGEQDLCDDGEVATSRVNLPNDRAVLAMDACGAERVRAVWTAPPEPQGAIWFHAVVVAANDDADPDGDGVEEIARIIPVAGTSAEAARVGSTTCAATGEGSSGSGALLGVVAALAAARRRRR